MANIVLIRGDKGQVKLEILGYENTQASTIDDSNWLRARIDVVAGPFSGSIVAGLTTVELDSLYQQLAVAVRSLTGNIDFSAMEGNLQIIVKFARTGEVLLQGFVTPDGAERNVLYYEFHTDPITLEVAVQELRRLVTQFPIQHSIHKSVE
jgi:hypothetical protein